MENKFWVKDVEWEYFNNGGIKIIHIPTGISEEGYYFDCYTKYTLTAALVRLEQEVNKHYENENKKISTDLKT